MKKLLIMASAALLLAVAMNMKHGLHHRVTAQRQPVRLRLL